MSKINEALARKVQARNEYDKTIHETEAAYMKILESSQTLLHVLKVRVLTHIKDLFWLVMRFYLVLGTEFELSVAVQFF